MSGDIHNPVATVTVRGETVEVRELTWKDSLRAVRDMTGTIMKLVSPDGTKLLLDRERLVAAISEQETLVSWVLTRATGRDQKWIDGLSAREVIPLLQAAVDLNLSPEVVGAGKALAGRMGEVFGRTKQSPAQSTR